LKQRHYFNTPFRCTARINNNKFPVETGSLNNVTAENRICELCTKGTNGDKFHYLLEWDFFADKRRNMLVRNLFISPNVLKLKNVMNLSPCNVNYTKFCKYVKEKMSNLKMTMLCSPPRILSCLAIVSLYHIALQCLFLLFLIFYIFVLILSCSLTWANEINFETVYVQI